MFYGVALYMYALQVCFVCMCNIYMYCACY